MKIIEATSEKIVINGIVPIDTVAPRKASGKLDSPDPLIRICHEVKKTVMLDFGACVAYAVFRPGTSGEKENTSIYFYFSNTGKAKVNMKDPKGEKILIETEEKFRAIMSARCADKISEYLKTL